MIGASQASSRTRSTISGTAAAAASLLTVMRTSSEPARASATIWAAVEAASAVSVFVIDCTTTGCDDPTGTPPMWVVTVCLRGAKATSVVIESAWRRGCRRSNTQKLSFLHTPNHARRHRAAAARLQHGGCEGDRGAGRTAPEAAPLRAMEA